MKKFKFLKNKLLLSSFALTTMGSLVLAACGPNNTTTSISPTALLEQKVVVDKLLSHHGFMDYLGANIANDQMRLTKNLAIVQQVGKINKLTVETSETSLGKSDDAASKEDNQTAFAYLKQVNDDLKGATFVVEDFKEIFLKKFDDLFKAVETTATNLTNKINTLSSETIDALKPNVDAFTKAINDYIGAKDANGASVAWKKVEESFSSLKIATKKITTNLSELIKDAFALDAAVTDVVVYVNDNAPTINVSEEEKVFVQTLNKFVNKVRKDVLGTIGKDLWQADAPDSVIVATSTLLYSVVVQLANESKAFTELEKSLKTLRFSKSLTLKNPIAINLLASHVDNATYLDVSRLNAYLLHDDTDAVEILEKKEIQITYSSEDDSTTVSLRAILATLVILTKWFKEYLMPPHVTWQSKLDFDLEIALETDKITDDEKTVITNFQTAFKNLQPELKSVYKTFFDSESNTSFVGMANNLIKAAQNTNTAIGLAQNFGSVLNVVAASKHMGILADDLMKNLPTTETKTVMEGSESVQKIETKFDENLAWVKDYKNLETKLSADKEDTDYAKALKKMGEYTYTTDGLADKVAKIFKITKESKLTSTEDMGESVVSDTDGAANGEGTTVVESSTTEVTYKFSGYLYDNVQLKLVELAKWFNFHTKDKLNPTLNKIINLSQKQLSPSQGSQTAKMMKDLAEIYYNQVTKS